MSRGRLQPTGRAPGGPGVPELTGEWIQAPARSHPSALGVTGGTSRRRRGRAWFGRQRRRTAGWRGILPGRADARLV